MKFRVKYFMLTRSILFIVCCLQITVWQLHARTFAITALRQPIEGLSYLSPGVGEIPLQIMPGMIRGPYEFLANERTLTIVQKDAQDIWVPAAQVDWPVAMEHGLVVLWRNASAQGLPFIGIVLDDSPGVAPLGSSRFVNMTPRPIAVRYADDQPEIIPAGGDRLFHTRGTVLRDRVQIAILRESGGEIAYSRNLAINPKRRTWFFITEPEGDHGTLDVSIISDRSSDRFRQQTIMNGE